VKTITNWFLRVPANIRRKERGRVRSGADAFKQGGLVAGGRKKFRWERTVGVLWVKNMARMKGPTKGGVKER